MISSLDSERQYRVQATQDDVTHFVVRVAIFQDGKLLVLRRAASDSYGGLYELPGGSVDENETFLIAAIRETLEETGLRVGEITSEFAGLDFQTHRHIKVRQINYVVTVEAGEVKLDPTEHDNYRWITELDIDSLEADHGTRSYLRDAFAASKQ